MMHLGDIMEEKQNRKTMRLVGYDYNTPGAYFLTICTKNKKCILSRIVGSGRLGSPKTELLPYGKIAEKYILQLNDFYDDLSIESYVIMPNHIHILLCLSEQGPSRTPVPTIGMSFLLCRPEFCPVFCRGYFKVVLEASGKVVVVFVA